MPIVDEAETIPRALGHEKHEHHQSDQEAGFVSCLGLVGFGMIRATHINWKASGTVEPLVSTSQYRLAQTYSAI